MQQFTLNTLDGTHLGFMVFVPDNEHDPQPQSGSCMLRLQAAEAGSLPEQVAQVLTPYTSSILSWHISGEVLSLCDAEGSIIADLRQQYLRIGGLTLQLTNLNGNL